MIDFQKLIETLPQGSSALPVANGAATLFKSKDEVFIAPDFDYSGDLKAPVWLVSAPAAVGKSFIAAKIADATRNPIWDLGQFSLGSNFFSGTMTDLYGLKGHMALAEALEGSEACLLLDAMDEAFVRVGAAGVEASMKNLATVLADVSGGPAAVIFGRDDTMRDVANMLAGFSVETATLNVQFFSEHKARLYVQSKSKETVAAQRQQLDEFLTRFFDRVKDETGSASWSESQTFLGYAPVLEALSKAYDADEHPLRSLNAALADSGDKRVWSILSDVLDGILLRECGKFSSSFGVDAAKADFARRTYTPAVQLEMLLTEDIDQYQIDFPDDGDAEWLTDLEKQLRNQYRDHPFLNSGGLSDASTLFAFANPVFRDYCCAWAIREGRVHEFDLASQWDVSTLNPAPLLSKFVFAETPPGRSLEVAALGIIADSHAASLIEATGLLVLREDEPTLSDVELLDSEEQSVGLSLVDRGFGTRTWPVRTDDAVISFNRAIAYTLVEMPSYRVDFGRSQRDFVMGPNVLVQAGSLEFLSAEVRVSDGSGGHVRLEAESISGITQRVLIHQPGSLTVVSPKAYFPWTAHQAPEKSQDEISTADLEDAGMKLRKILDWFARKSMFGGTFKYPVDAMGQVLGRLRASRSMFDYLVAKGNIEKMGSEYVLRLPVDSELVRMNVVTNSDYKVFLEDYLTSSRQ
jgi:hypothetical protein